MDEQVAKEYEEYKKQGRIFDDSIKDRIKKIKFPRPDKSVMEQFLALEDLTDTVCTILDVMGFAGAVPAWYLSPIIPGRKIAGPAITMRYVPARKMVKQAILDGDRPIISRAVTYLAEPGDVLVIDSGGNLNIGGPGHMSSSVGQSYGIVGTICNGAMRDIGGIRGIDYPVWCQGISPLAPIFRAELIEVNGPVSLLDVQVQPGDIMLADDTGVVVVPSDAIELVLEKVTAIVANEAKQRDLIKKNASADEHRKLYKAGRDFREKGGGILK
ncbi:RraA family protein [Chloroflexota bacterium]